MAELIPDPLPPPGRLEVAPGVGVEPAAVRVQFSRGSGPGGQNVNKLNTKAELWVPLADLHGLSPAARQRLAGLAGQRLTAGGEIHLVSDALRTQLGNRAAIFQRLREMVVQAKREPKLRRKTKPSRASKQRRLTAKRHRGAIKSDRRSAGDGD